MTLAYWNGTYMPLADVKVSPLDRGFLFADGVYEVVAFYDRRLFQLDEHLTRLGRSLREIRIGLDISREELTGVFRRLVDDLPSETGTVYLQVTRGAAAGRTHTFPTDAAASFLAFASPLKRLSEREMEQGFLATTIPDIRWQRCDIKAIALLPSVLAAQHAKENGALETIMYRDGLVTECASSNVFIVRDGDIATPKADHRILNGINRQVAISLARNLGLSVEERDVSLEELRSADEIWITSTTKEIAPMTRLDNAPVGDGRPGPLWRRVRQAFSALIDQD
ncbi:D-amino-acid transaminase [Microvirga sp. TS319]|uniref:D-amino-acid transaminase n=1 Tax=Microvirga sp. TS319 TaxID=3241165 RepID=UPI00351A110F